MQHEEPYALVGQVRFRRGAWAVTPLFTQELIKMARPQPKFTELECKEIEEELKKKKLRKNTLDY